MLNDNTQVKSIPNWNQKQAFQIFEIFETRQEPKSSTTKVV